MEPWSDISIVYMIGMWMLLMTLTVGRTEHALAWSLFAILIFVACELAFPQFAPLNAWLMALIFVPIRVAFAFRSFLHDMMPWMKRQASKEREAKKKERARKRYPR